MMIMIVSLFVIRTYVRTTSLAYIEQSEVWLKEEKWMEKVYMTLTCKSKAAHTQFKTIFQRFGVRRLRKPEENSRFILLLPFSLARFLRIL